MTGRYRISRRDPFRSRSGERLTEWTIRLEAKTGWGELEIVEVVSIARPTLAATTDDVGPSLAEAKSLMAKLQVAWLADRWPNIYTAAAGSVANFSNGRAKPERPDYLILPVNRTAALNTAPLSTVLSAIAPLRWVV